MQKSRMCHWMVLIDHYYYCFSNFFIGFISFCSAGLLWKIVCVLKWFLALYGMAYGSGCICIQRYTYYLVILVSWSMNVSEKITQLIFNIVQDFLRQNNTGKLLWQVFGVKAATLCLFGIAEHEEIMWNTFALAGFNSFSYMLFFDMSIVNAQSENTGSIKIVMSCML